VRDTDVQMAVDQCKQYGLTITVENVANNVAMKPGDYKDLLDSGLRQRVRVAMRRLGLITNDAEANTKVEAAAAKLSDLEELLKVKERNERRVHAQTKALRQLVEFLRARRDELHYDPYVHLFEEDARRIYAMHGLELPSGWSRHV
jgi:vacuolar-type H+-ATPase subunit I/STV1